MDGFLLQCMSHTPLMELVEPQPGVRDRVRAAIAPMRAALERFDPELIVAFVPDHYNSFYYGAMPAFCVGIEARTVGDFRTASGPLNVPQAEAQALVDYLYEQDFDPAMSYRMQADHGTAQPLALLCGEIARYPVIPVFVNCAAPPIPTVRRTRRFGEAVGRHVAGLGKRVMFLGSGGLSHEPPIPQLASAPPPVRERLIAGGALTPEQREAREQGVVQVAKDQAAGNSKQRPLNPEWDRAFLRLLEGGDFAAIDRYTTAEITRDGGGSGNEIRTWVAAAAAYGAATGGALPGRAGFYEAIPEWIAGFATLQSAA